MYEIDLNLPKQIVADVLSNHEIHSVAFVGCGASMSDLYPAKYFLANNTDKLNVQIFTANEFNYDTPSWVNEHTFVITCSLGGSTPRPSRPTRPPRSTTARSSPSPTRLAPL